MDRYVLTARLMFDTAEAAASAAEVIEDSIGSAIAVEIFIEEV